jgi:hypothetical protein
MFELNPLDQLARDMSLEQVQQSLVGWKSQVASAMLSRDRLHLFHTWDFTPPPGSDFKTQRMTFDNGKLLIWGEPAALEEDRTDEARSA